MIVLSQSSTRWHLDSIHMKDAGNKKKTTDGRVKG